MAEFELCSSSGWKTRKETIYYVLFAIGAYFLAGGSRQKIRVFGFGIHSRKASHKKFAEISKSPDTIAR